MSVPIRRLTTSQRHVFLVNSRLGLVTAIQIRSKSKSLHRSGHSFSRSYGVILPSSLTRSLSSTLGFSPHLPVSVYGTVNLNSHLEGFLGSLIRTSLWARPSYSHLRIIKSADLPALSPYLLKPPIPSDGWSFTSASPLRSNKLKLVREY